MRAPFPDFAGHASGHTRSPFFASVSTLAGVGPKLADLLAKLLGRENAEDTRVIDLLFHAPSNVIDRRNRPGIALAQPGAIVTIQDALIATSRHRPVTDRLPTAYSCMTTPASWR